MRKYIWAVLLLCEKGPLQNFTFCSGLLAPSGSIGGRKLRFEPYRFSLDKGTVQIKLQKENIAVEKLLLASAWLVAL